MADVLWLEDNPKAAAELPYRISSPDEGLRLLEQAHEFSVVAIGATVDEPVRLARGVHAADELVETLIITPAERVDEVKEALQIEPQVGPHTRAVLSDRQVLQTISEAAIKAKRRRRYQQTLKSAQSALKASAPATRRPSHMQYAASMWTDSPVAALAVVRDSHHIVSTNPAASVLLEQEGIDLIGKQLHAVLPGTSQEEWEWLGSVGDGEQHERVVPHETSEHETVFLEARATPVESASKDIVLVFLWDVTERVRIDQMQSAVLAAEKRSREAAERASRVREDVLATVSHDLRGPLQTLLTSAQLLDTIAASKKDGSIAKVGSTIGRAAGYMSSLVDDLLEIARMEDGGLSLDYAEVSVAEIVGHAIELASGAASQEEVHINSELDCASLTIVCDQKRVAQLLQNLLSNAIKFSPEGEEVCVSACRLDDETVRFVVADSGPGISPDKLPHLFERFWQADRRDRKGVGLGLAIVRGIVDAHGGDISVESEPGEGATFCVDLPIEPR